MMIYHVLSSYAVFFFFFSSRRRHTRLQGDWSSDVCSSDLRLQLQLLLQPALGRDRAHRQFDEGRRRQRLAVAEVKGIGSFCRRPIDNFNPIRSEERRVGKECKSRGGAKHEKKERESGSRRG